mgnify:CR=1 FL=1
MSRQPHGDGQLLGAGQPQRRTGETVRPGEAFTASELVTPLCEPTTMRRCCRQGRRLERWQAGVAIATVFRSHCRPGFYRVFGFGDHVGAEVSQLREAGHRRVDGEAW